MLTCFYICQFAKFSPCHLSYKRSENYMMKEQLVLLILLFLKYVLIQSQHFPLSYGKNNLDFYYSTLKPRRVTKLSVLTRVIPRTGINNLYILTNNIIKDRTLLIRGINCTNFTSSHGSCSTHFESSYIFLVNHMPSDAHVLSIENKDHEFQALLQRLSVRSLFNPNDLNLTCMLVEEKPSLYEQSKEDYGYPFSKLSLFGIIFLSVCLLLVFVICFGWFMLIYYRRFIQYRTKKKLQKALALSTQQMLDKSPVIIFDPANMENDDDPMCAICLEAFKIKEKIRKLVCSHYFHITCIDPWLLSHQSCPLCNRNILRQSIPSISSGIMAAINGRNDDESTTIANQENNQTIQAEN